MEKEIITAIGVLLTFAGYYAYIYSIFKGETRPHPFSWAIWGLLTAIGFSAQISDGAGLGAYILGLSAIFNFSIAIIGVVKRADIKITRSDFIIFLLSLFAIPLWIVTETPLWSVILISVIDAVAYYPTFYKTWHNPNQELPFQVIASTLKFILSLFALNHYSFITVLYTLSLIVMNLIFIIILYYRRWVIKNHAT